MGQFDDEKMYTLVKGIALGGNLAETLNALNFARKMHKGQTRRSGEPYIIHPLTMVCHAHSIGIMDDNILATILLHDTVEDCGITVEQLPSCEIVKKGVHAISFSILPGETKLEAKRRYYNLMINSKEATFAKLFDRGHNSASMAGAFSFEKLREQIDETREFVLPLLELATEVYPEMTNQLFALKYHIVSIVDSIDFTLKMGCPSCKSGEGN